MLSYPIYKELNHESGLDFNHFLKSLSTDFRHEQIPVDILESENNFLLQLALPGVKQEQIDIQLEQNQLNILVKKQEHEELHAKYVQNQIPKNEIKKSFRVSEHIDRDRVEASIENGILTIVLFKSEALQPRKIQVKAS